MAQDNASPTRTAWLEAGQELLRENGVGGVKLAALSARLERSSGSFYHHFRDMDAFLGELASYYAEEQLALNLAAIKAAHPGGRDRLLAVARLSTERRLPDLVTAMRAWACSDPRALTAVRALDNVILAFLREGLEEMGFPRVEAEVRAFLLLCAASVDIERPSAIDGRDGLMLWMMRKPG